MVTDPGLSTQRTFCSPRASWEQAHAGKLQEHLQKRFDREATAAVTVTLTENGQDIYGFKGASREKKDKRDKAS